MQARLLLFVPLSLLSSMASVIVAGCADDTLTAPDPVGPAPVVQLDAEFGESPLRGTLRIVPGPETSGWRYRIAAIHPDSKSLAGDVNDDITVRYRFVEPGVHVIRVELLGPGNPVVVENPVVVIEPDSDFEILAQRPVEEIWPGAVAIYPEGIVVDPQGQWLYAANYWTGELVRLDASTLEVTARLQLFPTVEGLAITPSGERLFAIHKRSGMSVVELSSFTGTWQEISQGHFIEALDETRALISSGELEIANVDEGSIEHESTDVSYSHFSLFPGRDLLAVAPNGPPALAILAIPSLAGVRSIPLPDDISWVQQVAVDPEGDHVYALVNDQESSRVLTVDLNAEEVVSDLTVYPNTLCWCAANPVVTFGSGRYVAFEKGGAVVVVDTELGIPRYLFQPGDPRFWGPSGVAAVYESDVLYVLGGNTSQHLYKVRLRGG